MYKTQKLDFFGLSYSEINPDINDTTALNNFEQISTVHGVNVKSSIRIMTTPLPTT